MKSITSVSPLLQGFIILIAMQYLPAAYSFGVDPGVVSREISRTTPSYNQQNTSTQPYVLIYQDQPSEQNTVTIDRKNKPKRN